MSSICRSAFVRAWSRVILLPHNQTPRVARGSRRLRLGRLLVHLAPGKLRPHQKARAVGVERQQLLSGAERLIPARFLVVPAVVGEAVLLQVISATPRGWPSSARRRPSAGAGRRSAAHPGEAVGWRRVGCLATAAPGPLHLQSDDAKRADGQRRGCRCRRGGAQRCRRAIRCGSPGGVRNDVVHDPRAQRSGMRNDRAVA